MRSLKKKASEAAATAPKAQLVTPEKLTPPHSRKHTRGARPSLRAAIDAMCRSCIYDPGTGNGTWREQVQACSSGNCPLHAVRPMTVKSEKRDTEARQAASAMFGPSSPETPLLAERLDLNGPTTEQRRAA